MKVCQGKELVITATENKLHNVHDTMNVQLTHQVFPCYQKRKLKRIYRSYSPLGIDSRTDVSPRPRVHYTDELKKTQRKQTSIFCWFLFVAILLFPYKIHNRHICTKTLDITQWKQTLSFVCYFFIHKIYNSHIQHYWKMFYVNFKGKLD